MEKIVDLYGCERLINAKIDCKYIGSYSLVSRKVVESQQARISFSDWCQTIVADDRVLSLSVHCLRASAEYALK